MATATLKKRDLNRFTKVYPYSRFEKREVLESSSALKIETGLIDFTNEYGPKSYSFVESFASVPSISAISITTSDNSNVNIYVTMISTTTVSFESSAPFTGQVSFSAIQVS